MIRTTCIIYLLVTTAVFAEDTPMPDVPFAPVANQSPADPASGGNTDPDTVPIATATTTAPDPAGQADTTGTVESVDTLPLIEAPAPKSRPSLLSDQKPTRTRSKTDLANHKTGVTIAAQPGVTESVVIARDKLNRIVTPYANPKVLTTDNIESKVDGNSVYVATASDAPVSLFISDTETGHATSLQLIPDPVTAPVEVRIEADLPNANAGTGLPGMASANDKLFRQASDYQGEIKAIMQALARQLVPSGFSLAADLGDPGIASLCHSPDITFSAGQTMVGHEARIVVLVARNTGGTARLLEEAWCASEQVIAVAAWPSIRLVPGEAAEVYVLLRNSNGQDGQHRPPLL